jgi:opacity protein-like surface antigen
MLSYISKTIIALVITLILLNSKDITAQSGMDYKWYANANLGISQLYSDIQDNNNHITKLKSETSFGYGARLGRYISPVFAVHFQGLHANFKGQKTESDLKFESSLIETQLGTTVNLSNLVFKTSKKRKFFVYATAGIGLIFYKSKDWNESTGKQISQLGYTSNENGEYNNTAFILPVGLGLDFKISDRWFINLESVLRFTNVDKIDAKESGNHNDAYYYTSVGVSYNFDLKRKKKRKIMPQLPVIAEIPEPEAKAPEEEYPVSLIYHLPEKAKTFDTLTVRSTINISSFTGRAELTQILPVGFELLDTIIGGTRADYRNYTLNMFWNSLPEDSIIEISYKVQVDKIYGLLPIVSLFYLEETGKEYKYTTNITVEKANPPQSKIVASATEDEIAKKNTATDGTSQKVQFKIQIRAENKTRIPLQRLANKYHIREQITEDHYDEWYRYSVGSFNTYFEAIEYRDKVRNEYNIRDAFIVAYQNGIRLNSLHELKNIDPDIYKEDNLTEPVKTTKQKPDNSGRKYRVQIYGVKNDRIDVSALKRAYNIDEVITEEKSYQWTRYTVGNFNTFEEANRLRKKMTAKGIKGAFIVTYSDGKRILIDDLDY